MYKVIVHTDVDLGNGLMLKAGEVYNAQHCYTHYIEVDIPTGHLQSFKAKVPPSMWYHNCSLVKRGLYVKMEQAGIL